MKILDETGNKYGILSVIERAGVNSFGKATWKCLCECGSVCMIVGSHMRSGNTKSCGCQKAPIKHGLVYHPIYGVYRAAKARCTRPNWKQYKDYGGRGIEFKLGTFEEFAGRMLPTWVKGLTLGRIDNNGHYEYENIRWETYIEQGTNKRGNVYLTYNGETKTITTWARELGICSTTLNKRIRNWGLEKALTIPKKAIS